MNYDRISNIAYNGLVGNNRERLVKYLDSNLASYTPALYSYSQALIEYDILLTAYSHAIPDLETAYSAAYDYQTTTLAHAYSYVTTIFDNYFMCLSKYYYTNNKQVHQLGSKTQLINIMSIDAKDLVDNPHYMSLLNTTFTYTQTYS